MSNLWRLVRFLLQPSSDAPGGRRVMILVLFTGALSGAASTGLIVLINRAVARGLDSGLIWAFGGLCVALPAMRYASQRLLIHLSQNTMLDLRMRLSRRILATPLRHLETLGAHRMLATLTEDINTVREVSTQVPLMCMQMTVVIGCLLYIAWLSPQLMAVVGVFLVIGVATYRMAIGRGMAYFRRARESMDRLVLHFRALTEGIKELQIHGSRRLAFFRRLFEAASAIRRDTTAATNMYALANSWGQTLSFAAMGLLFVLHWSAGMFTAETITGTVLTILYVRTPLDVILQMIPSFNRASVSLNKIQQLGLSLAPADERESAEPASSNGDWRSLQLAGVTHVYRHEQDDGDFTLGPIELTFRPGELVFVVGGNGSGKTTLAKLILGLYRPESGEILLDGQTIDEGNRDQYQQLFTAVFSDFFLFDTLLGLEGKQELDEEARRYLALLHLDRKVRVHDGVLSTTDLSQGQRKRLALLTAYLEDRSIFLFDEWAADQDPYFKEIFYLELLPQLCARGKTILVISHDDRYYSVADRIIKLDYGSVVYDGPLAGYASALPESVMARRKAI
jgi:putative pyoverdin transport system ATP-binding/permease protein